MRLSRYLNLVKVLLSSIFLIEIVLRIITSGTKIYLRNVWNILDLLIITLCLVTEVIFTALDREDLELYDGYMMGFRCWYIIRCISNANSSKEIKVSKIINKYSFLYIWN